MSFYNCTLYPVFRHKHDVESGDSGKRKHLLNQGREVGVVGVGEEVVMLGRNSHGDVILSTTMVPVGRG